MPKDASDSSLLNLDVAHVEEYFGLWAMRDVALQSAVLAFAQLNLWQHLSYQRSLDRPGAYDAAGDYAVTDDGVAVLSLRGALMKYGATSLQSGTSTVLVRRQIRNAVANEGVSAIVLAIDSPGGTVAGTADLADEVAKANRTKPVYAYIEDLGASAAYWVASQARRVYANRTAMVGSIGTYGVIYDSSALYAKDGVKVHIVRAGKFKGAGEPGTEISTEQLEEWQGRVDELNEFFVRGVASGRKLSLSAVRDLADGRVHVGQKAVDLKLADEIATFSEAVSAIVALCNPRKRKSQMSSEPEPTTTTRPQAASYEDIKVCCPGADAAFLCSQLERKATIDQAQSAWMEEQNRRLEATEKKRKEEQADHQKQLDEAKAKIKKPGVEPLTSESKRTAGDGDPVSDFDRQVRERMDRGLSRRDAVRAVAKADPELHHQFLKATNPNNSKVQSLIDERFELV